MNTTSIIGLVNNPMVSSVGITCAALDITGPEDRKREDAGTNGTLLPNNNGDNP